MLKGIRIRQRINRTIEEQTLGIRGFSYLVKKSLDTTKYVKEYGLLYSAITSVQHQDVTEI